MITTTVVGSYPRPDWLVDRERFTGNVVPRIRLPEVWRVSEPWLEEAQDDAVRLAVGDMEAAGIDVLSDGEQRRESYFNRFATALGGVDPDRPGSAVARLGRPTPVPRVVGPIERVRPVWVAEATFLRAVTRCAYGSSVRGWGLTSRGRGPAAGKRGRRALMLPCMKPAGRVKSPRDPSL